MNPMIAFGWAVQSGAYKVCACVSSCAAFCRGDDFPTLFFTCRTSPPVLFVYMYGNSYSARILHVSLLHLELRPLPGLLDCSNRGRRVSHGTVRRLPSVLPGRRREEEQERLKINRIQKYKKRRGNVTARCSQALKKGV